MSNKTRNWIHNRQKIDYVWKVGDILKTTRDMQFEDAILPKDSIVRVYSRNQGYNVTVLQPAVFDGIWCSKIRIINNDDLREIENQEWVSILND